MPVEVAERDPDAPTPEIVDVTYVCEGCGEPIKTVTQLADRVDEDARPVHPTTSCRRKGRDREVRDA